MLPNNCMKNMPEKGVEAPVQYEQNIKIARVVSGLYNVETLFLLQPDARYNYPMELYRDQTLAKEFIQPLHRYNEIFYSECKSIEGVIDLTNLFRLWEMAGRQLLTTFTTARSSIIFWPSMWQIKYT
jgi:hypothetical protein